MILKEMKKNFGYNVFPTFMAKLSATLICFPLVKDVFFQIKNSNLTPVSVKKYLNWSIRRAVIMKPHLKEKVKTGKALVIYSSNTGNTEKVAFAIGKALRKGGLKAIIKKVSDSLDEDYYEYDLVCIGTPCFHALPTPSIMKLLKKKFAQYRKTPSDVRVPSEPIPGKYALVFVTFSGPHVGVDEAYPAGKLLLQEFEHLGFDVKGEWYFVSEFHGWAEGSTVGKMGDIRGRPNGKDLALIEKKTVELVKSLDCVSTENRTWIRT